MVVTFFECVQANPWPWLTTSRLMYLCMYVVMGVCISVSVYGNSSIHMKCTSNKRIIIHSSVSLIEFQNFQWELLLFKGVLKQFCSNGCGIWRPSCWYVICNYMMYTTESYSKKADHIPNANITTIVFRLIIC